MKKKNVFHDALIYFLGGVPEWVAAHGHEEGLEFGAASAFDFVAKTIRESNPAPTPANIALMCDRMATVKLAKVEELRREAKR